MTSLPGAKPPSQLAQRIYALLVGIDHYPLGINPLQGCVNDINALETYLNEWVNPTGDSPLGSQSQRLVLQKLTNEHATRDNIIASFRHHLRHATPEDVVLFAYSGHGSQEKAHAVFKHLEPDGLNETLLCYDSRQPGQWPLADKELNALLAEIGERCPHIVVILDCCHSGHGVRDIATVRRMATDTRDRPLDSYLLPAATLAQLAAQSSAPSPSGWYLSGADHYVLLAACQDSQTAKEYPIDGKIRGAFSHFLLESLKQANGNLTYRDLFRRTKALVESNVPTQSPQLEAPDQASLNPTLRTVFADQRYNAGFRPLPQ